MALAVYALCTPNKCVPSFLFFPDSQQGGYAYRFISKCHISLNYTTVSCHSLTCTVSQSRAHCSSPIVRPSSILRVCSSSVASTFSSGRAMRYSAARTLFGRPSRAYRATATCAENQPYRRVLILMCPVLTGIIEIKVHLSSISMGEFAHFKINDDKTSQDSVEENEIYTEPPVADAKTALSANECKISTQFKQEFFQILDKCFFQIVF